MADTSYGYPGSINAAALAKWIPNVAAAQYSVDGPGDCRVVIGTGDRVVQVKAGTIIGDGILDIFNSPTNLTLSAPSGTTTRWDMIVCRRTWSSTPGASTSVFTVIQGSATKGLPSRNNNKGVQSDQPIALCRVVGGQTAVQEIIDLRCFAHNGGVFALDELVMGYIDQPGTHLTVNDKSWIRKVTTSGSSNGTEWDEAPGSMSVSLYGRSSQQVGNPSAPGGSQFMIQTGLENVLIDANNFGRINWPKPFPNGLLTFIAMNADNTIFGDMTINQAGSQWGVSPGNKSYAAFRIYGNGAGGRTRDFAGKTVKISYIAIGW